MKYLQTLWRAKKKLICLPFLQNFHVHLITVSNALKEVQQRKTTFFSVHYWRILKLQLQLRSSSRIFYRYIGWRNWLKNYFKMVDSRTPIIKKNASSLNHHSLSKNANFFYDFSSKTYKKCVKMEKKSCVNNQWEFFFLSKTIVLWFSATCQYFMNGFFTTQPFFYYGIGDWILICGFDWKILSLMPISWLCFFALQKSRFLTICNLKPS